MTNSKVNRRKALIALRAMLEKAESRTAMERVKAICRASDINYSLLAVMDEDTFKRAVSEEFNQVDQFYKIEH